MSNERLEVLGGLPLFEPLSPDERERLAVECRMRRFARGAALFREGERADGMHIVLRGVVKVVRFATDGREMVLHLVREGNTIGEAAMFQKGTFPASAVAVDDVETLFLPAEALFALVTENPEMALRMLAALSLRLRMFAHKLAAQGQGGAACRLATYLLHRRQIGGGDCIRLGVSREVLANLLGLARETLSRQLSRFSEAGLVELRGKDIIILDVPALQATAAEGDIEAECRIRSGCSGLRGMAGIMGPDADTSIPTANLNGWARFRGRQYGPLDC